MSNMFVIKEINEWLVFMLRPIVKYAKSKEVVRLDNLFCFMKMRLFYSPLGREEVGRGATCVSSCRRSSEAGSSKTSKWKYLIAAYR